VTPAPGDVVCDSAELAARRLDVMQHRQREYAALSIGLELRLREGSLPPDDAYHWTVILLRQADAIGLSRSGWVEREEKAC
jgi:hypothetical protein